jgi:2-polyprenyl-6-hydroxyphenyl methylase / 3-demethylubiquinone-9 3-methyltransferase
MTSERTRYEDAHWIRSHDPATALAAYLDQQSKAYSRVKNAHVAELIGDLSRKRFLDYGCGGGLFTVHAALSGAASAVGVDAEETILATARYHAATEGVERLCRFAASDTFPRFPAHLRFDVILIKDVIEHVTEDQALLNAAAHVLAPGGRLVVSTQNSLSLNYAIQGTYHRLFRGDKQWYGWDRTHVRFYTPFNLQRKLRKAGLTVTAWRSVYVVPYKLPAFPGSSMQFSRLDFLSWLDRTLGRVFPYNRLGWNVIVRAEASPLVPVSKKLADKVMELPRAAAIAPTGVHLRGSSQFHPFL